MGKARPGKAPFKTVARVSPTHQVREQLLQSIERGDYGPGDLLPSERALCEMFGVSRVSVREAIAGLEAMGLVTVRHGSGCFVSERDGDGYAGPFRAWLETHRDEMVDLLKVRGALDELAASEAAAHAEEAALGRLENVHERFRAVVAAGEAADMTQLVELDVEFHHAVVAASGSELLVKLLKELAEHIADSRRVTFGNAGQPARSLKQHEAIVRAIRDGHVERARKAARHHVAGVRQLVEEHG